MGHALVTGGAGFVGSHLVERLVSMGVKTTILDNLKSSSGYEFVSTMSKQGRLKLIKGDCATPREVKSALHDIDTVFHFAANPDIRSGVSILHESYQQNVNATRVMLEGLEASRVESFVFASSSTVYGEAPVPTKEDYGPLLPISVYGATKLAAEALTVALCGNFGRRALILRFANIVGPRTHRGVVYDFVKQLGAHPHRLRVLGDGHQRKSYLYIDDCIDAILTASRSSHATAEVYNIGSSDTVEVKDLADLVVSELGLTKVKVSFAGGVEGGRGWKGDVKKMHLDISKMKDLGWKPKLNSRESVRKAARLLMSEKPRAETNR